MKKSSMFLALMLLTTSVFAGAVDPCRMIAYQYCAEKFKTGPVIGPNGTTNCTVNPRTPEFKACEEGTLKECRGRGVVFDITSKPCN